jgi:MFS family permease
MTVEGHKAPTLPARDVGFGLRMFAAAVAFGEAGLYSMLAPLLPALTRELQLSDTGAGILSAAYPVGMVLATWPAGLAAGRHARGTAIWGMWAIAVSSVGFALGSSAAVLITSRLLQGAGAAAAWTGALAWIVRDTRPGDRGMAIGATIGAGFAGTVVAPLLAGFASGGARAEVFLALAAVLAVVAAWGGPAASPGRRLERPAPPHAVGPAAGRGRRWRLLGALALMVLVGAACGLSQSLATLRLASLGLSGTAIAAVFLAAYAPQAVTSAPLGRLCDRLGASRPVTWCMGTLAVGIAVIPLVEDPLAAGAVVGIVTGVAVAGWPMVTVLVTEIDHSPETGQGMAMALVNGAWAGGAAAGAAVLTAIASAAGEWAAYAPLAVGCGLGALALSAGHRFKRPSLDL